MLRLLAVVATAHALPAVSATVPVEDKIGAPLLPWRSGELHLHHIDTGRGNCTLAIYPDGTTLMIDAGAGNAAPDTSSKPRPDASRRAGEWQARYALRHIPQPHLDYFVATHIHPDHIGDIDPTSPLSADGSYRLTGPSDVERILPIGTVVDRAFPNYGATAPANTPFATNYTAWLRSRIINGRPVVSAQPGSAEQLRPQHATMGFTASIVAANGVTAAEKSSAAGFPENDLSIALTLRYGNFGYFAGGDLTADTYDGAQPAFDRETPTVQAAGPVDVASADHHGYFDACGPAFVRVLDASVYIIQAWDVGHPGSAQMQRMLGAWTGSKAQRDVFATDNLPANALLNRRFVPLLKSTQGHVVVRVAPGGSTYTIAVLDSTSEEDIVRSIHGPYTSRGIHRTPTTTNGDTA